MIEANNSQDLQQHSAWPFPSPKCMDTSVEKRQPAYFPASLNPSTNMISARSPVSGFTDVGANSNAHVVPNNIVMPDYAWPVADTCGWKMQQRFEYQSFARMPSFPVFSPTTDLYHRGKPTPYLHGDTGEAVNDNFFGSVRKRFLIFDKSGSRTELISHAMCPPAHYQTAVYANQAFDLNLVEKRPFKESPFAVKQPSINENLDEKQTVEESMTHEDTEELNALLYSDEANDDSSDDSDDIISTDHSPSIVQGNREKAEGFEEIIEEVASSDHQNKRQKGACGSVNLKCSRKLDTDAESHTGRAEETGKVSGKKRRKNENIHEMIRVLESVVPGAKGKDPLLVLNESIRYLKSLKVEAKCLGFYPLKI